MPSPLSMMINIAAVTSRSWGAGSDGSPSVQTDTLGSSFVCSIQHRGSSESIDDGRDMGTKTAVMYYPTSITIQHGDYVTAGGVDYVVNGPPRDVAGRGVFYEVDLEVRV